VGFKPFRSTFGLWFVGKTQSVSSLLLAGSALTLFGVGARPADEFSYHVVRLALQSSSDWAELAHNQTEYILSAKLVSTDGDILHTSVSRRSAGLQQPLVQAQTGGVVRLTWDLAVSPQFLTTPGTLALQKGSIGRCTVDCGLVQEQGLIHVASFTNSIVNSTDGRNTAVFPCDYASCTNATVRKKVGPDVRRTVWAIFCLWYGYGSTWADPWFIDSPLRPYTSDDPNAMERQIIEAKMAGIDGFAAMYFPYAFAETNLLRLLDTAARMRFPIALMTSSEYGAVNGAVSPDAILTQMRHLFQLCGQHPALQRLDGRPVLFWYAAPRGLGLAQWADLFGRLRREGIDAWHIAMDYSLECLEVFDGLYNFEALGLYDHFGPAAYASYMSEISLMTRHYWLLHPGTQRKVFTATAQPGFDDRQWPPGLGRYKDRDHGNFYRDTFGIARGSEPDWIVISTWNFWEENSYIEPSQAYGNLYLEITEDQVRRWKQNVPAPLTLSVFHPSPCRVLVSARNNASMLIEESFDLLDWRAVLSNTNPGTRPEEAFSLIGSLEITNSAMGFYRLRKLD